MQVEDCKRIVVIVANNRDDDDDAGNEITFRLLQHLKLSNLTSLRRFCSGNCIVKFPSSINLDVTNCLIELKISPDGVLQSHPIPQRVQIAQKKDEDELQKEDDDDERKGDDGDDNEKIADVETAQRNNEILREGSAS